MLDRDSVQSSLRRQFGLQGDVARAATAELGISEMLADLYRRWADPLDDATLLRWHQWLMQGRTELRTIGDYRKRPNRCKWCPAGSINPRFTSKRLPPRPLPRDEPFIAVQCHEPAGERRCLRWHAPDSRTSTSSPYIVRRRQWPNRPSIAEKALAQAPDNRASPHFHS